MPIHCFYIFTAEIDIKDMAAILDSKTGKGFYENYKKELVRLKNSINGKPGIFVKVVDKPKNRVGTFSFKSSAKGE